MAFSVQTCPRLFKGILDSWCGSSGGEGEGKGARSMSPVGCPQSPLQESAFGDS